VWFCLFGKGCGGGLGCGFGLVVWLFGGFGVEGVGFFGRVYRSILSPGKGLGGGWCVISFVGF